MSQSDSVRNQRNSFYAQSNHTLSHISDIGTSSQGNLLPSALDSTLLEGNSQPDFWHHSRSSQNLLPTPVLLAQEQRQDDSGAAEPQGRITGSPEPLLRTEKGPYPRETKQRSMPATEHEPRDEGRHGRRATRRGPMDEMRQLVRILVKIIPQSAKNIRNCDEGGGGNRISEDQIKQYLSSTLGDAPQPKWGVPNGWSSYLAEVFSWVTGRAIRKEQASRCAKREPGRSWEAIDSELAKLGILPSTWPLPLSKEGMGSALIPAAQYSSSPSCSAHKSASPKRSADGSLNLFEGSGKRLRSEGTEPMSNGHDKDEVALWSDALLAVNLALGKAGSSDTLEQQMAVAKLKAEIQSKVQVPSIVPQPALPSFLTSQPQLVPISVPGPNGQVQTAYTLQIQQPGQLPLAPQSSLDLASQGFNAAQFFVSQPGSSAFQAVKPTASDKSGSQGSQLLSAPPPLCLSSKSSQSLDSEPSSPSNSEEGNSAAFYPNNLAWNSAAGCHMSTLFKPTALKTDNGFYARKNSQADSEVPSSISDATSASLSLSNLLASNPMFQSTSSSLPAFPLLQSLSNLHNSFAAQKPAGFSQFNAPVQQAAA